MQLPPLVHSGDLDKAFAGVVSDREAITFNALHDHDAWILLLVAGWIALASGLVWSGLAIRRLRRELARLTPPSPRA